MPDDTEITRKFWTALRSDMTVMLGTGGDGGVAPRPMTAMMDGAADHGPIWFFTARSTELARTLQGARPAFFAFTAKGTALWASVTGQVSAQMDRAVIDRLWSPFVAAWYEGGKEDPELVLLRFDPAGAEIWLDGSSLLAGLKLLLGADPKAQSESNVARVLLR
jgi:general stress protein 26